MRSLLVPVAVVLLAASTLAGPGGQLPDDSATQAPPLNYHEALLREILTIDTGPVKVTFEAPPEDGELVFATGGGTSGTGRVPDLSAIVQDLPALARERDVALRGLFIAGPDSMSKDAVIVVFLDEGDKVRARFTQVRNSRFGAKITGLISREDFAAFYTMLQQRKLVSMLGRGFNGTFPIPREDDGLLLVDWSDYKEEVFHGKLPSSAKPREAWVYMQTWQGLLKSNRGVKHSYDPHP